MYTGKSHLITGAGWDRTIGWLVESNNKTIEQVFVNSKDWGNYLDSSFTANGTTGSLAKTGAFGDNIKANNIYDLAGKVEDWTSENKSNSNGLCVIRGGFYCVSGGGVPASGRGPYSDSNYRDICGFRVALFL